MTKDSTNPHLDSYAREIWEKAVETEKGLKITFSDRRAAERTRFALYRARNADKKMSRKIYTEGAPEYDASPWDVFRLTIEPVDPENKKGHWNVCITKHDDAMDTPLAVEAL